MRRTRFPRSLGAAAATAVLFVLWLPRLASAAVMCTYDPAGAITVTLGPNDTTVLAVSNSNITDDGTQCGTATVQNTDTITVTGSGSGNKLTIDLSGGAFAPGLTPESPPEDSEIEFSVDLGTDGTLAVVGGSAADEITAGAGGINLNAGETTGDVDVTLVGSPTISIKGGAGDDMLSVAGGAGTGAAVGGVMLTGEDGNDTLIEGSGDDDLGGGDGTDTVDLSDAGQGVTVSLGDGTATGDGSDTLTAFEDVTGSPFDDVIDGDGGANTLSGGSGDDVIDGHGGDDALDGGAGSDTARFASASSSVTVSLEDGDASGDGSDTLTGFEDVTGSGSADHITGDGGGNMLRGGAGADEIHGRTGADIVVGGDGADELSGGDGGDILSGGSGKDQLNGGRGRDACHGGPGADSFTACET